MKFYWTWLLFNVVSWTFAFIYSIGNTEEMTWRLGGVAVYFAVFFIMPLVMQHPRVSMILLSINICVSIVTLFPVQNEVFTPYLLLIISLLIGEAVYHLPFSLASVVGGIGATGIMIALLNTAFTAFVISFVTVYFIFLFTAFFIYKKTKDSMDDLLARYDALLSEYRKLKRHHATGEEIARQEERMLIAHEIHDSVGHKLTALLMQLEVFRLNATDKDQAQVQSLKELAHQSLEETRSAVKTLKSQDVGGLPGVLRLIRKLETESFIRIHFSVKHGAFTAPLTSEQSFIIYRSVQEALTNIMKHSKAREAEISFEAPGGSIFRFEICNPIKNDNRFQEGYGLTSMRERLEKIGGHLDVQKTVDQFMVSGFIKLVDLEGNHDTNTTG